MENQAIPQTDRIWDVSRVPAAIAAGHHCADAIAMYLGGKATRQGAYSVQSACILGVIACNELARTDIARLIMRESGLAHSTALRRAQPQVAWLCTLGTAQPRGSQITRSRGL